MFASGFPKIGTGEVTRQLLDAILREPKKKGPFRTPQKIRTIEFDYQYSKSSPYKLL